MGLFDLEALKRKWAASDERGDAKFTIDFYDMTIVLERLEQAEQGRAQAVADYEAAELKLLYVRDLSEYLKKLAPGDKHYAGLIDRALDGDGRG